MKAPAHGVTRKTVLTHLAGGSLLLWLGGCGGGGSETDSTAVVQAAGCTRFTFTADHGHALVIPTADLDSTTDRSYSVQGSAAHDHRVTLTAAQLAALKAGQSVTVTSTMNGLSAHTHDVGGSCT